MNNPLNALVFGFATAFALTYVIIPLIINVATQRRIYDLPNERSSHLEPTPSLGGIAIFAGSVCGIMLWTPSAEFGKLQYILAAFVVIFLIGILDDLFPITPGKKLIGQLLVAIILTYKAGIIVSSLYGLFGLYQLPDVGSILFSIIIIVGIINAFNLIDGINGLAGCIALLSCLAFGSWFYLVDNHALAVVSFSLAGAVVAFLRYNFTPAKIFMGDTGSLLLGTVCAILAISFIETSFRLPADNLYLLGAAPAIAIAVLILPLYDTLSVLLRRLIRGRSPFRPDKTHVHHQLLSFGFSHTNASIILLSVNFLFIALAVGFHHQGFFYVLSLEAILAFLFTLVLIAVPRLKSYRSPRGQVSNRILQDPAPPADQL